MMKLLKKVLKTFKPLYQSIEGLKIDFARPVSGAPAHSLIFFPVDSSRLNCGICALVTYTGKPLAPSGFDLDRLIDSIKSLESEGTTWEDIDQAGIESSFLGGRTLLDELYAHALNLKEDQAFFSVFLDAAKEQALLELCDTIKAIIEKQQSAFKQQISKLSSADTDIIAQRIEKLQDIFWCLKKEILDNMHAIRQLTPSMASSDNLPQLSVYRQINAVLNSIDRLEVRGRDSAGISIMFSFTKESFEAFRSDMKMAGLSQVLKQRTNRQVLTNRTISINDSFTASGTHVVSICFVYKFAAEIGALGDNIAFIRNQIKTDALLQTVTRFERLSGTVSAHTRWASVGAISEANCHPVDNEPTDRQIEKSGIIHVCLNGDIDNYLELKTEYEATYDRVHEDITTDTKLIPLQIEHYYKKTGNIEEAFRLSVNDFSGSHAISMHTDLAPGKLFLAQKGSGQALFVGIGPDHYIAASELYGVVEETPDYIKLNGEDAGQIVILDQHSPGGVAGITSMYYNSDPIVIDEAHVQTSQITSRDIDRQQFPHYFLKEISESPRSVEKTLENKFKQDGDTLRYIPVLEDSVVPVQIREALKNNEIRKIFFIGQGTAGVAAQGCADLLDYYLGNHAFVIRALKSSELSGFSIDGSGEKDLGMTDTLVIAISQSGTTTDTNRTVDMAKAAGARTLCIVNRRDSDLTFKTEGVLYTSSGRDIEMSVASTKAFYSQIAAGAILSLYLANLLETRSLDFITEEITELLRLPEKMDQVLDMKETIKASAQNHAIPNQFWATVGSGANKTSADEIRIKLSELCYKTISSDYIEDKKHIDLSSEPLIIVCAAGTRESVLKDIIKDTAIFNAHKATPIVITTEGEDRFDTYASDVFKIPHTQEHFAPVLNTLVGHIWGYYAALAFNEGSQFMYNARTEIQEILDEFTTMGHDLYEVLLEKRFREKVAHFSNTFSRKRKQNGFPTAMGLDNAANMTLLLKYLSGRLPVSDFEMDFDIKGTPSNMLNTFYENIGFAINAMSRPVDAIKHQAKTVTVGTSRTQDKFEGILFDELSQNEIMVSQITNKNVLVMKNLQEVISEVKGSLLYRLSGLNLLGEPTGETKIQVIAKHGSLESEISRVESDPRLRGTKNIIVREGNVYIGRGRKDQRNILVIPVISASPATPNIIEYILSLHVAFKDTQEVSLLRRIKALGGKYTRIKDWILESASVQWDDKYLNLVAIDELFGNTAEKVVESIVEKLT